MRRVVTILVLVALVVATGWLLFPENGAGGSEPGRAPGSGNVAAQLANGELVVASQPGSAQPPPLIERRVPVDLADHATAFLEVVDAETAAPIEGAAVYRFQREEPEVALGYTDGNGIVALPLREPGQMLVVCGGYLMRLSPTHLGSTESRPQRVQLVPDSFSRRGTFRFVLPDGQAPAQVCARFAPARDEAGKERVHRLAMRDRSEIVRRAWSEHATVAAVHPLDDLHLQAGQHNAEAVHVLSGVDEVLFVQPGIYDYDFATPSGFVARGQLDTERLGVRGLVVALQPGSSVFGKVCDVEDSAPIANAMVLVTGGDPLQLRAATDTSGAFQIGPLADGDYRLDIYHRDYEHLQCGPFRAGPVETTIRMTKLPAVAIRGRVVGLPDGQPVARATVSTPDALGQPISIACDLEGFFTLSVGGRESRRVTVGAPGYLAHIEMLEPGSGTTKIELWPLATETRVSKGLTALLRGIVVDRYGVPVAGKQVQFVPDQSAPAPSIGGRRILQGGRASLPVQATTSVDGTFALETPQQGKGMLVVVDGREVAAGQPVVVELGRAVGGLRIEWAQGR